MKAAVSIPSFNNGGGCSADMLRLHLNESPYGPPPGTYEALKQEISGNCSIYPESTCEHLRQCIATFAGVTSDMIAVGNGIDELILLITLALSEPGTVNVITDSTFPGYASACAVAGAAVRAVHLNNYRISPEAIVAAVQPDARVVFVCNPHNPTGTLIARRGVDLILTAAEAAGAIPVFDEAYMEFAEDELASSQDFIRDGRRAIMLRTFSKAWGLASIRIGYALGPRDLIGRIWQIRAALPFNVNRIAQHIVPQILARKEFPASVRARTAEARALLCEILRRWRVEFIPSTTNFLAMRIGGTDSAEVTRLLAEKHRILVRDLGPFGMPGWIRVSIGKPEDVERFCSALGMVF